ncbi:HD domain-containing phosphohydrolase [Acetohalobium arabaticum]|uniref:Putative PAS/PAC sensor protein n=1 Tax=Acetohalobium arabaticum (strain ATCC 49924 / DSM 5501 / Z-7288) TaxID=574087 RepID=D9QPT4_ACEAZ|nr:HD domain-containing phosphohydrolase [Acetohalobium arabaticum]ADL12525.1 putative PAS/PAC sensor protein [Acetohalobium arabaticum DSM 5501]
MAEDNHKLFKTALKQISKGIIITNDNNKIIFANEEAKKIKNISQTELIGKDITSVHPDDTQNKIKQIMNSLQQKNVNQFTTIIANQDNQEYLNTTYKLLENENNDYIGTMQILSDKTSQIKFEEEKAKSLHKLEKQVDTLNEQLQDLFISSMTSLVKTLEAKDSYTKGHSLRVCEIATKLAEHKHDVSTEIDKIKLAGKLHDIGKVGTQETILNKSSSLSDSEFNHIKQHPIMSEEILSPIERFKPITKMVRHHHERYDGTGYPDGLKQKEIPLGSRIVSIADSYDAMTSNRPYRSPMNPKEAVREIKENLGTQFDPELGKIFLELFYEGKIEE